MNETVQVPLRMANGPDCKIRLTAPVPGPTQIGKLDPEFLTQPKPSSQYRRWNETEAENIAVKGGKIKCPWVWQTLPRVLLLRRWD
ncbi:hypothetical protein BaRGS_00010536 [Batillaria attramentaria]|uniref:Uncharacterized protein n=1 Tax=Batillaria attramentaria TaxID=370345 RepID=A0ABD0LFY7_9CAEN